MMVKLFSFILILFLFFFSHPFLYRFIFIFLWCLLRSFLPLSFLHSLLLLLLFISSSMSSFVRLTLCSFESFYSRNEFLGTFSFLSLSFSLYFSHFSLRHYICLPNSSNLRLIHSFHFISTHSRFGFPFLLFF